MKEEQIKNTVTGMFKQFQTVAAILYLLAVGLGMLFEFQKYDEFGINIFEYSDVFDFLLAPFSDVTIFGFTLLAMSVPYGVYLLDQFSKRKFPKWHKKTNFRLEQKEWYGIYRFISFSALLIVYLAISSDAYGSISRRKILNEADVTLRFADNETKKGKMIGQTYSTIFMLVGEKVQIVPYTAVIKDIEIGVFKKKGKGLKKKGNE